MTITKEQIEAARKAAPVHLGPALDSTIEAVGEAILGAQAEIAAADAAMKQVWSEWCTFYCSRGFDLSMADKMAFFEIAQPVLRGLTTPPADEWTKVVSRLTQERDEAREENERLTRTFRAQNERLRFALLDSMELQERAREESRAKGYFRKLIDALKGDA